MYPTYVIPADMCASDARWLQDQQGDGPLDLIDITDVCVFLGVHAIVHDRLGDILGRVDPKGAYDACGDEEPDTESVRRADAIMDAERDEPREF